MSLSVGRHQELRRCQPRYMLAAMQLHRQMKMAASLTHDIKRQVVKLSFDSAEEITEEMSTYKCVAIHLSVAAAC